MSDQMRSMLEEIDRLGEGLTGWEIDFVAGLIDSDRDHFTEKQQDIIRRIYEERVP